MSNAQPLRLSDRTIDYSANPSFRHVEHAFGLALHEQLINGRSIGQVLGPLCHPSPATIRPLTI
jgi:hypothetical protein